MGKGTLVGEDCSFMACSYGKTIGTSGSSGALVVVGHGSVVVVAQWWWLSGVGNSGSRSKMVIAEGQLIVAVYLSLCLYKNLLLSQNNSENINFE